MSAGRSPEALREYALGLSRLDQAAILKKLGIKHYDKDILRMSKPAILREFGNGPKRLNKSLFIKNVIWQTFERIKAGQHPFDVGNLRSFWYYIKPTLDRIHANKGKPYLIISDMFMVMVQAGLFKYRDFRFKDDDKGNRWHARKNPHIIFFAEKTSYNDLMQEVNRDFDITTLATGGQPSYLSAEYFVDELRARGVDLSREFILFSFVDFDPAGDIIASTFVQNLLDNGIPNIRTFPGPFYKHFKRKDIFVPANMTPDQLKQTFTIPLRVRKSGLAAKWAARTGGIDGKKNFKLGFEANQMPNDQVLKWLVLELSKVISIDLAAIAKFREMGVIHTRMRDFALKKLQLEG